jgi:hypothetical protein
VEDVEMPEFPWPPPRASGSVIIPSSFFRRAAGDRIIRLGDVDRQLTEALNVNGYFERSYYHVPAGFALATRLEQFEDDGRPSEPPNRWAKERSHHVRWSLSDYIRLLFTAEPGHYRIIVFIVTHKPFSESETGVDRDEAMSWVRSGWKVLPETVTVIPFKDPYYCTAFIYEFLQKAPGNEARLDVPGLLSADEHLVQAKIWSALQRPQ